MSKKNVIEIEKKIEIEMISIPHIIIQTGKEKSDINEHSLQSSYVKFFPNPAKNKITLHSTINDYNVTIYSMTGKKIITTKNKTIDVSNLKKGCYVINVFNDQFSQRQKLIIE